jgi:hypothetical protein
MAASCSALKPLLALEAHQFFQSSQELAVELRRTLSAVAHVYTDGFDAEQVWEQLQLQVLLMSWLAPLCFAVYCILLLRC